MNKKYSHISLQASERFLKAYRNASLTIKKFAEGAVHDLINRYRSNPLTLLHYYDKLAGCRARIIEVDICGGPRLLAAYFENRIVLLDMGNHETVKRYNDNKYDFDMLKLAAAPSQFFPEKKSNFFVSYPDTTVSLIYKEEVSKDWVYFLENEQNRILNEIFEGFIETQKCSAFIVGGPGTGKTCILINLLHALCDSEFKVGISISDNVTKYIEDTADADISRFRVNLNEMPELDLLLVDDPTKNELVQALKLKQLNYVKTIVAAFDPLQMDELISDQEFNKIRYDNKITPYQLNQCYRQKENLGTNTKRIAEVIAFSNPFVAETKIQAFHQNHKKLTTLANNLEFVNPNGYIQTYEEASIDDIQGEVNRIWSSRELMWHHCQGLLVIMDGLELSAEAKGIFKQLNRINYVKTITMNEVNKVKGLEFQHVFIFIKKSLFDEIENGFKGSGQRVYHQRRLLRIPFSRAKDSLVTFAYGES